MHGLIEVDGLSVRRGVHIALRDLRFQIEPGDFLAIVGPNGAGKTTLLLALLGLLRAASGLVRVDGRDVARYRRRDLARMLSYVPQTDGRSVSFSVEEFVLLGRYAHRARFAPPDAEDRQVMREALEATGTTAFLARPMSSLSGGERQKVFIAAALAQEARVLVLDEPTAFLDPRHHIEVATLLRTLNCERALTVVMVTHDVNLAARCGTRVLALREGAAVHLGPADAFLTADVLDQLYGVPFEILRGESDRAWAAPRGLP